MLEPVHDAGTLRKHPQPFFADEREWRDWEEHGGPTDSFLNPNVSITREKLFTAIDEVEKLAAYIDNRLDRAEAWRQRQSNGAGSG